MYLRKYFTLDSKLMFCRLGRVEVEMHRLFFNLNETIHTDSDSDHSSDTEHRTSATKEPWIFACAAYFCPPPPPPPGGVRHTNIGIWVDFDQIWVKNHYFLPLDPYFSLRLRRIDLAPLSTGEYSVNASNNAPLVMFGLWILFDGNNQWDRTFLSESYSGSFWVYCPFWPLSTNRGDSSIDCN